MKVTKLDTGLIKIEPIEGCVLSDGYGYYDIAYIDPRKNPNRFFDVDGLPDCSEVLTDDQALAIIRGEYEHE